MEELKEVIYFFGYAGLQEDPGNRTGFYRYERTDP
jgi:hypothetical protein